MIQTDRHFACCKIKATQTQAQYIIRIARPRQRWLRERATILVYTYTVCLVLI
jgi:hypothetical protein